VIDNDSSNAKEIQHLVSSVDAAEILCCNKNYGLGHAHNLGIQSCREARREAVLLLDQDTIPNDDMVSRLLVALNKLNAKSQKTAAVGARYIGNAGQLSFFVQFSRFRFQKNYCSHSQSIDLVPADMLISSGSLIPMSALDIIGDMDETLFIDHIDTEWFLRAKSRDWHSYGVCNAIMQHSLGEDSLRLWWGRWRYLPIHLPFRYYFIYRNSITLHRRSYVDPNWRRADIIRLMLMAIILPLFSKHRIECLQMIFRGIRHGVNGKSGPLLH